MSESNLKCSEADLLIRKPVSEVFQAFVDPEVTKHFWFTKGSDKLEVGKTVIWEWEMYNFSTKVVTKEVIPNQKIVIEWFTSEVPTLVDFNFKTLSDGSTFVSIKHYGFDKTGDELLEAIKDSTGGFTIVLAGLKAYLEHNINLNLILDKFPKELMQHGKE
ncbi:SRPBCC family protein [Flavobacterium sp. WC2509]|uniref:SRPBCC family protein n=1 Tax=Flavobacterium sp. WC2509 TaxID=3461406 RepID=UPI0040449F05